jgi:hypothetical protein
MKKDDGVSVLRRRRYDVRGWKCRHGEVDTLQLAGPNEVVLNAKCVCSVCDAEESAQLSHDVAKPSFHAKNSKSPVLVPQSQSLFVHLDFQLAWRLAKSTRSAT